MSDTYTYGDDGIVMGNSVEEVEEAAKQAPLKAVEHKRTTILDSLRDDFKEKGEKRRKRYVVPERENYEVEYVTFVDYDQLQQWVKKSSDAKSVGGMNELRFATTVLANTCRAIFRDGERIEHDGDPVTFRSDELMDILGTFDHTTTIRTFYGLDGHVIATGRQVLVDAGYGNMGLTEGNPTSA